MYEEVVLARHYEAPARFAREDAHGESGDTVREIQIEEVSIDVPAPTTGDPASVEVGVNDEFRQGDLLGHVRPE